MAGKAGLGRAGLLVLALLSGSASADFTISSVTLNGGATAGVSPGASISASVTLDYSGNTSGANGSWSSTQSTVNGVSTCTDHTDHAVPGPDTVSFNITAPAAAGTYDVSFRASSNSNCGGQNSPIHTLTGGIQVRSLLAEYRLEEDAWAGVAGEVRDSSGNNRHGTAIGVPLPGLDASVPARSGSPGTCDYGEFGGAASGGPALSLPGLPVDTRPGARTSVAFWMYWDGSDSVMPIGWGRHDLWLVSGAFGFNTGNSDVYGISSSGLAGGWHHVVAIFTNGAVTSNALYIDGVSQTLTQRLSSPANAYAYVQSTLQVAGWTYDSGYRFSGRIDEVKVYDGALSQADVSALYTATHACPTHPPPPPATLVAEYRFDDTWSASDPLADSSGNGRDAGLVDGGVAQVAAPAGGVKPDTCQAGSFSRSGYFNASGLNVDTTAGAKSTVAFWMYWDGTYPSDGWAMPFRWDNQYYDVAFRNDGWFGFNTGQGDVTGFSSAGLANGWHHVAAVFSSGGVGGNRLYIDGQLRSLQSSGSPAGRSTSTGAVIGAGGNWSSGYKFGGRLDGLRIYRGELSQGEVTTLYQQAQPCVVPIAEWRMDEAAWTGTAGEVKDNGGNHFDGRAYNGANTTTSGRICNAGNFTGTSNASNQYVDLGSPSLGLSATMTVSAWVNWQVPPGSGNAYSNIFTYNSASTSDRGIFWLQHKSDNSQFEFALNTTSGRKYIWSTSGTAQSTWKHVVGVYDGSYLRLYVDGVASGSPVSQTGAITSSAADPRLAIGHWAFVNSARAFRGWVDEVKVYSQALAADQVRQLYAYEAAGRNWDGSTRTCATTSSAPAALNAVDVGANPVTGQIASKTAGSAFSLDLYALNAAGTAQDSTATGDVLVDLLANAAAGVTLGANNCPATATSLAVGTVTLAAGRATAAIGAVADSWRDVRVRMRYPATGSATVTACSSDNFAVKPAALTAIASDTDWGSAGTTRTLANIAATGGVVHKAGQPFTLRITGYNAGNVITGNYDGSPTVATSCVLPASGCLAGSLNVGSFTASAGTLSSSTATFSEVGAIAATFVDTGYAGVDADDSAASCAGFHVCAGAINIGRFVPDHYDVASIQTPLFQTFASACASRSFTYLDQPFGFATLPRARITAKNAAGGTTGNAKSSLWKLSPNGHFGSSWRCQKTGGASCGSVRISTPGFSAGQVSVNGDGSGDFTWPADEDFPNGLSYQFRRTTPPAAPFNAELGLGIVIRDSSEAGNCGLASCLILDSQPVNPPTWGSQIAFDAGNEFRQGRLRLANAVGSELLPLPLQLSAQYWNGQGWVGNDADQCTAISAPGLTFFSQTADNRLGQGETVASFNATLVSGNGNLRFTAPGVGNFGFMEVSVTAPAWLQFNWDGTDQGADGNLLDDNPRARASFGKRRGSDRVIIRREMY